MVEFIKWFWISINFRNWTFENRKLANPFVIIIRLILIVPIIITSYFLILLHYMAFNKLAAEELRDIL